jgi:alpha-D-ribose 1-methylphosphonate 5-triphosphate diphosphatase
MTSRDFVVQDVTAVLPDGTRSGISVRVVDGVIAEVRDGSIEGTARVIDGADRILLPGCIDLHSDAIEREIEPRPRTFFPVDYALHELDKRLAGCGVTTIFHALSFAEGELGVRSNQMAVRIIEEIEARRPRLGVNTLVHARFEITDESAVPLLEQLIDQRRVELVSFMDHTPGQGQYREAASFKQYYGSVYGKSDGELDQIIATKQRARLNGAARHVAALIQRAHQRAVPLASHDVDSAERVRWLRQEGINITEFPIDMVTVREAHQAGLHVMLGSPNVLRGTSTGGNLSARAALAEGHGDILCSDYAPQSLLHAVFTLDRLGIMPLHEAVNLVSRNPARAVGLSGATGSIEEGKDADLVLVEEIDGLIHVLRTFVAGRQVFARA